MHHPKGFPSRLVRLRAEAGMTQRELAKASGVSLPQIGRYEMGASKPRMTALVKLAKALNVEVAELENADAEPETVAMTMITKGSPDVPLAFPKAVIDEIQADADKHGVTLEEMLVATLQFSRLRKDDPSVSFEDVLAKTVEELKE